MSNKSNNQIKKEMSDEILVINLDEDGHFYDQEHFNNEINKYNSTTKEIKDYEMIIVCTQNSLSNTDKHFQHFFKNYITKGNEFNLVSKVDATRQSNRGTGFGILKKKTYNKNVRTRVYLKENNRNNESKALKGIYFNPSRVNSKWKNSYNTNKKNGESSNNNRRTIISIQNRDKTGNLLNQSKCKYELVRIDLERKTISDPGNLKSGKGYIIYYFWLREIKLQKKEKVSFPFIVVNNYSSMTLDDIIKQSKEKNTSIFFEKPQPPIIYIQNGNVTNNTNIKVQTLNTSNTNSNTNSNSGNNNNNQRRLLENYPYRSFKTSSSSTPSFINLNNKVRTMFEKYNGKSMLGYQKFKRVEENITLKNLENKTNNSKQIALKNLIYKLKDLIDEKKIFGPGGIFNVKLNLKKQNIDDIENILKKIVYIYVKFFMNKEYDEHGMLILKNNLLYNYFEKKNGDLSARIKSIVTQLKTSNKLTMNVKKTLRSRPVATVTKNWNYTKKVGLLCDFLYSKDPIIGNSYSNSKKSKMIEVVKQISPEVVKQISPNIPFSTSKNSKSLVEELEAIKI